MTTAPSPLILRATLTLACLATLGCGDAPPQAEDGPLPRTPASTSLQRMRVWTGSWPNSGPQTKWQIDGKLMWPHERVAPIQAAIEAALHEDLRRTQLARIKGRKPFRRPATCVEAVVVSLSPDIALASVRHNAVDSLKYPFDEWLYDRSAQRIPVEAIGGSPEGPSMSAGLIAPFAEEMYVVAGDRNIPAEKIQFENDEAEVTVQNAILKLRREGNVVRVDVEYR